MRGPAAPQDPVQEGRRAGLAVVPHGPAGGLLHDRGGVVQSALAEQAPDEVVLEGAQATGGAGAHALGGAALLILL